jgi:hypothetical protein
VITAATILTTGWEQKVGIAGNFFKRKPSRGSGGPGIITEILSDINKCKDPDGCKDHYCLIIRPKSTQIIFLIKFCQTDKETNYGDPIY